MASLLKYPIPDDLAAKYVDKLTAEYVVLHAEQTVANVLKDKIDALRLQLEQQEQKITKTEQQIEARKQQLRVAALGAMDKISVLKILRDTSNKRLELTDRHAGYATFSLTSKPELVEEHEALMAELGTKRCGPEDSLDDDECDCYGRCPPFCRGSKPKDYTYWVDGISRTHEGVFIIKRIFRTTFDALGGRDAVFEFLNKHGFQISLLEFQEDSAPFRYGDN